ncbi:hypothetical protein ZWY2020_022702 [Hordeum vulgare]|nr:hypothetical protein ZWY2020_022702 [Hordeum vulgare]
MYAAVYQRRRRRDVGGGGDVYWTRGVVGDGSYSQTKWAQRSGHVAQRAGDAAVNGRYPDRSGRNWVINTPPVGLLGPLPAQSPPPTPCSSTSSPSPRSVAVDLLATTPSWNDEETSSSEDCEAVNMDMGLMGNGVNCGVVEWVDGPWPPVLRRCLSKLWEIKLVEDVSKIFDWQDGRVDKKVYQKQVEEEDFEKNKKEVEEKARLEVQLEKLKLANEQRCILQSQADIMENTRKAMKDVEVGRDLLKKEKAKLERVVAELLKDVHGSKEKLEKI